ncbi:site-specific integrase [Aquincola tertiaricarbonis]|uniref:Site-specific integrase n=1 Tax=Aquincola tertiaricarbonis TaxID=391953 RepID=A0ABY4SBI6_AQUTE|nr:site-specific integrase [Aquincola tertiaricarbonis]URI09437.1 site-specific integrase [Aquincola tertiaricarbonis]
MASVSERKNKDGSSSWLVQIRVPGAQRINRCFPNKHDALHFAHAEDEKARSAVRRKKVPSLKEFNQEPVAQTLLLYATRPQAEKHKVAIFAKIAKLVGKARQEEVDDDFCESFILKLLETKTRRGSNYAPSSAVKYLELISAACKWRAKHHRVSFKPLHVPTDCLPDDWNDGRDRRLLRREEKALSAALLSLDARKARQWRCLIRLAIETGARQSELVRANWDEFDLEQRVWNIPKGKTKAKKARWVALSRRAIRVLRLLKAEGASDLFDLGQPSTVSCAFARLTKVAGINDLHFHDLRHEAITRMFLKKKGLHAYEIMRMVGHSSLKMLHRYANLRPEDLVDRMG